jgi:hypothetical protein
MNTLQRILVLVWVVGLCSRAHAGAIQLADVPACLPAETRDGLSATHAKLSRQLGDLRQHADRFNHRWPQQVPADSPDYQKAMQERAQLDAEQTDFNEAARGFNKSVGDRLSTYLEELTTRIAETILQLKGLHIEREADELERIAETSTGELRALKSRLLARLKESCFLKGEEEMALRATKLAGTVSPQSARKLARQLAKAGVTNEELLEFVRTFGNKDRAAHSIEQTRKFVGMLKQEKNLWDLSGEFAAWEDDAEVDAVTTLLSWCSEDPVLQAVIPAIRAGDNVTEAYGILWVLGSSADELTTDTEARLKTISELGRRLQTLMETRKTVRIELQKLQ